MVEQIGAVLNPLITQRNSAGSSDAKPEFLMKLYDLAQRLDEAIGLLVKKGIDRDLLYERALITPACGLGPLPVPAAERAIALTRETSAIVRESHGLAAG